MVRYRLRVELRTKWKAWLGLALLVGAASGPITAFAAGARRTDTAYERFLESQDAYDVAVLNYPNFEGPQDTAWFDAEKVAGLPEVADWALGGFDFLSFETLGFAPLDGRFEADVNRPKVLEGRLPDPASAGEVAVGFDVARAYDLDIGDMVPLPFPLPGTSDFEALPPEYRAEIERAASVLPGGQIRVVGIVASPGEFPPHTDGRPCCLHHSRAFAALQDGEVLTVRLEHGSADVPAFRSGLQRLSGGLEPYAIVLQHEHAAAVARSLHVQALALYLLTAVGALVAVLVLAQLLSRLAWLEAASHETLAALGASRVQLFAHAMARAALIGAAGAAVAVVVAVLMSPVFPTGLAGTAEPDPGFAIDASALAAGALATVLAVVLAGAPPAWLAARIERSSGSRDRGRTGALLPAAVSPVVSTGIGMALDRGRGRTAVPVWRSLGAVALGVGALGAAFGFTASADHLLATPDLYGVGWDVAVTGGEGGTGSPELGALVEEHLAVEGIAVGATGLGIQLDGVAVGAAAFEAVRGHALPPVLEGRAPSGPDEIALGTTTLQTLGLSVGDTVRARTWTDREVPLRVVGRVIVPPTDQKAQLGSGAWLTIGGAELLLDVVDSEDSDWTYTFLRLRPGADAEQVVAELEADYCRDSATPYFCALYTLPVGAPREVVDFGRVRATPYLLADVLAVLAAGALIHVLLTAIHRRRRDLALLRALGFTPRQIRATIRWLGSTVAILALAIGVPLGVVVGRLLWQRRALDLGIPFAPRTAILLTTLLVPATLLLANAIAWAAGRSSTHARPGELLRED